MYNAYFIFLEIIWMFCMWLYNYIYNIYIYLFFIFQLLITSDINEVRFMDSGTIRRTTQKNEFQIYPV